MRHGRHLLLLFLLLGLLGASACSANPATAPAPGAPQGAATATATPFAPASQTPIPPTVTFTPTAAVYRPATVQFAVIGDFGLAGPAEAHVADLVHSWHPDFIVTVGDNNYPDGQHDTVKENVLQYYGDDIRAGRFYPALGNHDWHQNDISSFIHDLRPPNGRRYYDFVAGPVHIFVLDSDYREPDGSTADSPQGHWLHDGLQASTSPWNIVILHHPPYSSGRHGSQERSQWPFAQWGADAVIAGHDHDYERILRDGIVYFIDGLGGIPGPYYFKPVPVEGSVVRYRENYGALRVTATATSLKFEFINIANQVVDSYTLGDH